MYVLTVGIRHAVSVLTNSHNFFVVVLIGVRTTCWKKIDYFGNGWMRARVHRLVWNPSVTWFHLLIQYLIRMDCEVLDTSATCSIVHSIAIRQFVWSVRVRVRLRKTFNVDRFHHHSHVNLKRIDVDLFGFCSIAFAGTIRFAYLLTEMYSMANVVWIFPFNWWPSAVPSLFFFFFSVWNGDASADDHDDANNYINAERRRKKSNFSQFVYSFLLVVSHAHTRKRITYSNPIAFADTTQSVSVKSEKTNELAREERRDECNFSNGIVFP